MGGIISLLSRFRGAELIDCFDGSSFISLTASKLNLFDYIILNEASTRLFNFHCVFKGDKYGLAGAG